MYVCESTCVVCLYVSHITHIHNIIYVYVFIIYVGGLAMMHPNLLSDRLAYSIPMTPEPRYTVSIVFFIYISMIIFTICDYIVWFEDIIPSVSELDAVSLGLFTFFVVTSISDVPYLIIWLKNMVVVLHFFAVS